MMNNKAQITIPIRPEKVSEISDKILEAKKYGDMVEIWGDKIGIIEDFSWIPNCEKPLLFCLKDKREKGEFVGTELERVEILCKAKEYFDYVDVGICTEEKDIKKIIGRKGKAKTILSFHDFEKTPENLEEVFLKMKKFNPDVIKIALMSKSYSDSIRLLKFLDSKKDEIKCVFLSMGKYGKITRIFSPIIAKTWGYAAISEQNINAEGQLTSKDLQKIWKIV